MTISIDGAWLYQHERSHAPRGTNDTDRSHVPRTHPNYAEWSEGRFRRRAAETGKCALAVTNAMLRSCWIERQSYRPCRTPLAHGKRNG